MRRKDMELINGDSNPIDKTRESIKKLIEDCKIELEVLSRMNKCGL